MAKIFTRDFRFERNPHFFLLTSLLSALALTLNFSLSSTSQAASASRGEFTWTRSTTYPWPVGVTLSGWRELATSGDGRFLLTAQVRWSTDLITQTPLVTSGNFGESWIDRNSVGSQMWGPMALSYSGKMQYATIQRGAIYRSSDFGETWEQLPLTEIFQYSRAVNYSSISTSDDGQHLALLLLPGILFISSDGGESWNRATFPGSEAIVDVAISSTGSTLYAIGRNSGCWQSTDSGATWELLTARGGPALVQIRVAHDGRSILLSTASHELLLSRDRGKSWRKVYQDFIQNQKISTAISADGSSLVALFQFNLIAFSSDGGTSWETSTANILAGTANQITFNGSGTLVSISSQAGIYQGRYLAKKVPKILVPINEPFQSSAISKSSELMEVTTSTSSIDVTGLFIENIRSIHIDGLPLPSNEWSQERDHVRILIPRLSTGNHRLEIYNGSVPALGSDLIVTGEEVKAPDDKKARQITYLRCRNPKKGLRVIYGVNPTCPDGSVSVLK